MMEIVFGTVRSLFLGDRVTIACDSQGLKSAV